MAHLADVNGNNMTQWSNEKVLLQSTGSEAIEGLPYRFYDQIGNLNCYFNLAIALQIYPANARG
ncbi:MAG TPA: hypothetical protein V6D10_19580 [Trichocoleus sp.]|jgi:hypothetical protein